MPSAVMAVIGRSAVGVTVAVWLAEVIVRASSPPTTATSVIAPATMATTVIESRRLDTHTSVLPDAQRRVRVTSAWGVGDPVPVRLRTELDRLGVAIRLHVAERVRVLVEHHV